MYIPPINLLYESPVIEETAANQIQKALKDINHRIDDEISNRCIQIAYKYGIDINEKELMQALKADRERYEEAYRRGWKDCEKRYKDAMRAIECNEIPEDYE